MTVLAWAHMRCGEADAARLLDKALPLPCPPGKCSASHRWSRRWPEAAWLRGDPAACLAALRPSERQPGAGVNAWEAGEIAVWRRRAGQPAQPVPSNAAPPWRLELEGDPLAAAQAWLSLGAPNEAALALLQAACSGPRDSASKALTQAPDIAEGIGARLAATRVRGLAQEWGLQG